MDSPTKEFYEEGRGNSLIDPLFFPSEVKDFLKKEELILFSVRDSFDLLIEIGCMHGRYLDWTVAEKKLYIGIDVVVRFIEEGRKKVLKLGLPPVDYQFIKGKAEDIAQLISSERLQSKKIGCLLFFPFNSFGNMEDAIPVISALKLSRLPFLISSYQTTEKANTCRKEYYSRCGYKGIRREINEKGVYFYSADGLRSVAYHPEHIKKVCETQNLAMATMPFSTLGTVYFSSTLKINNKFKPE